jgi:hypothetical protein
LPRPASRPPAAFWNSSRPPPQQDHKAGLLPCRDALAYNSCDRHKLGQLADIEPLHVAAYIEALGKDFEKPTMKQHLAAIRMCFEPKLWQQLLPNRERDGVR